MFHRAIFLSSFHPVTMALCKPLVANASPCLPWHIEDVVGIHCLPPSHCSEIQEVQGRKGEKQLCSNEAFYQEKSDKKLVVTCR